MLEKIKSNKEKLVFVLSIIAGALLIPSIVSMFSNSLTEDVMFSLIRYGLLLAANVILIVMSATKKKFGDAAIMPAFIVFYLAPLFINVISLINGSFSALAYIALYGAILVVYGITFNNAKLRNVLYILILISVAFFLASALSGGAIALSILITSVILFANIYINNREEE